MARARENVGQRPERSFVLENFRGVDLTSSPLRVDPRRAVKARNLLPYGGRNVKRRGWRQEADFREYDIVTGRYIPQPVRGMWWYTWSGSGSTVKFLLVHAGNCLYARREGESHFETIRDSNMGIRMTEGFAFGGRLYLIGNAQYLVFGTWDKGETFELRTVVDDEDTYIPRTTMAINPTTDNNGEAVADTRRSLDAINLLSSKRINTCMGRVHGGKTIILRLDGGVMPVDGKIDMTIDVETADKRGMISTERWRALITGQNSSGEAWIYRESELPSGDLPAYYDPTATRVGELYYGAKGASIWINVDCPPPLEGRDNITVTFSCAETDAAVTAAKIGKCRFGVMFGGGGNADRLFLAGNPDHPNYEFYSGWRDPTYFPDNGWNAVGSDASAIVGFSRVSDGVLATFKEEGRGEPVIYYHTAEDEPLYDGDGQLEAMRFKLFTDAGNAGEGMISRLASADFYGDPLILSRNGVFGISYKTNVETADRYAAERSRNIRADLLQRNLSKACGAVWDNKYWLAVDGVCYVADAGYTCKPAESTSGYQYEWWVLDNVPATVMCVADGKLWFGTDDGRICRFGEVGGKYEDQFRDLSWEQLIPTTIIHDADDMTRLIVSDEAFLTLRVGDRLTIESGAYALWLDADEYKVESDSIVLNDPDRIINVRDGIEVFADTVGQSGLLNYVRYTIGDIDRGWGTFCLFDAEGKAVAISEGGFRLGISLTGRELHVVEMIPDEEDGLGGWAKVSLYEGGEPLTMMQYDTTALNNLYGRIVHVDTVVAEWYTPVMDLGTNTQRKTLTRLTVAIEPGNGGRVSFGYETRAVTKQAVEMGGMAGLDLTALDFADFSLSDFAASWTARVLERNINYISFRWRSDEASDCRVDSITARYKVTGDIRGGL